MTEPELNHIHDKASLRRRFKDARQQFIKSSGKTASHALTLNLRRLFQDLKIPQVALYSPLLDEASFELEGDFYYPVLTGDDMDFYLPNDPHIFEPGPLGIPEPDPEKSKPLDTNAPALICCPAVAIDWHGNRLGQGKGYYDRFFQSHPTAVRVGVVYQIQVTKDPLPVDSWDQTLDWVVTEEMILRTSKRSP